MTYLTPSLREILAMCLELERLLNQAIALGGEMEEEQRQWREALALSCSSPEFNGRAFEIFSVARIAPRIDGLDPVDLAAQSPSHFLM